MTGMVPEEDRGLNQRADVCYCLEAVMEDVVAAPVVAIDCSCINLTVKRADDEGRARSSREVDAVGMAGCWLLVTQMETAK